MAQNDSKAEYTGFRWNWKHAAAYVLATGILTFAANAPTWEIRTSFINTQPPAKANAKLLENPLLHSTSPWLASHNQTFFSLQPLAVSQGSILKALQTELAKEHLAGNSPAELQQAISPRINAQSNQLEITVHTGDLNATERLATHLNYLYRKAISGYQQEVSANLKPLTESAMMHLATQRETGNHWMTAALQSEQLETLTPPSRLADLGADELHNQYTLLETWGKVQREMQAQTGARETFYLGLLPEASRKAITARLGKPSSLLQKHINRLSAITLKATLLPLKATEAAPEWMDLQDDVAARVHEINADSRSLSSELLALLPPENQSQAFKSLTQTLAHNHIQSLLAQKGYALTREAFNQTLAEIDALSAYIGPYQTWSLKREWLDNSVNQLAQELDTTTPGASLAITAKENGLVKPVKHYHMLEWLGSWLLFLGLPWVAARAARKLAGLRVKPISTLSWTRLLHTLSKAEKPQITLLIPQNEAHNPQVALNLSESLTRCGRHTVVMDIDVYHRELSQWLPESASHGLLHHLLDGALANPFTLPGHDAHIIPIEASLNSATSGNFRQILSRLPQVWQRWTKSHIVLDAARWYPVYEILLPYIDRVVAYPAEQTEKASNASLTPPWALFQKQGVTVTRLENLPTLKFSLDEAGLNGLDRRLNPIVDR